METARFTIGPSVLLSSGGNVGLHPSFLFVDDNASEMDVAMDMITRVRIPYKSKEETLELVKSDCVAAGAFLVPMVAKFYGVSIQDLEQLRSVFESANGDNEYLKVIFEAYVSNGKFEMNKEQTNAAIEAYVKTRDKERTRIKRFMEHPNKMDMSARKEEINKRIEEHREMRRREVLANKDTAHKRMINKELD